MDFNSPDASLDKGKVLSVYVDQTKCKYLQRRDAKDVCFMLGCAHASKNAYAEMMFTHSCLCLQIRDALRNSTRVCVEGEDFVTL